MPGRFNERGAARPVADTHSHAAVSEVHGGRCPYGSERFLDSPPSASQRPAVNRPKITSIHSGAQSGPNHRPPARLPKASAMARN